MSFSKLSSEEKTALAQNVREALNSSGLQSVNIQTYREEVLAMNSATEVAGNQRISLEPSALPTTK